MFLATFKHWKCYLEAEGDVASASNTKSHLCLPAALTLHHASFFTLGCSAEMSLEHPMPGAICVFLLH
jgi:hypothetical protein